tara:strand:+ start:34 stop:495 length:462 start_codon:yes stop_codon:yes gene_type:complete
MRESHIYKNISGSTAVKFGVHGKYNYTSLKLCNTHTSDSVKVDVYCSATDWDDFTAEEKLKNLVDGVDKNTYRTSGNYGTTTTYYIIKNLSIPSGVTLVLEDNDLKFDSYKYNLYIKLAAGTSTVDAVLCGVENKDFIPATVPEERDRFRGEY